MPRRLRLQMMAPRLGSRRSCCGVMTMLKAMDRWCPLFFWRSDECLSLYPSFLQHIRAAITFPIFVRHHKSPRSKSVDFRPKAWRNFVVHTAVPQRKGSGTCVMTPTKRSVVNLFIYIVPKVNHTHVTQAVQKLFSPTHTFPQYIYLLFPPSTRKYVSNWPSLCYPDNISITARKYYHS